MLYKDHALLGFAGGERGSHALQSLPSIHNLRMRASERALRGRFNLLEQPHALAKITESGAGVIIEPPGVIESHRERELGILSENASRYGDIFSQQ